MRKAKWFIGLIAVAMVAANIVSGAPVLASDRYACVDQSGQVVQTADNSDACKMGTGVPAGKMLPKGANALTEVVTYVGDNPSVEIVGGTLTEDFVTTEPTGVDIASNAWAPYPSTNAARKAACEQGRNRSGESWADGYTITVNGSPFTDWDTCLANLVSSTSQDVSCDNPVHGNGATVQESDDPICLAKGEWVVARETDNGSGTIAVYIWQLDKNTFFPGTVGMKVVHVWYNYGSPRQANIGACGEAKARASEANGNDPTLWDWGYVVSLNSGEVPTTDCKTWAATQVA